MKRLFIGQLLLIWSLSSLAQDIRPKLKSIVENFNSSTCVESAKELKLSIHTSSPESYLEQFSQHQFRDLSLELWDLKLALHQKMRELYHQHQLSVECARSLRGVFKEIRLAEDIIEEAQLRHDSRVTFPKSAFEEGNPQVHRARGMEGFHLKRDLKSGDLILSRGSAFTSAAIASLGEEDTQFSHLSIVYRDESNQIWTVEAHIEVGSIVRHLEDHIKDSNFRTMIFRFDDPQIAAKAAKYAFEHVKKASQTTGNINYDFGFDMDEEKSLFCSEIISWAFEKVTNQEVRVPFVKNRVQLRKSTFVHDLGISIEESFIPADLEIDPRFSIIAEWRDANRINDSHEKDAVLQAMYQWVDRYGYKMKNASSGKSRFYRNIVWVMRRTPLLKIYVKEKLPMNMSRELIGYFGVLESIGELLQAHLKKANEEAITCRGLPLLPDEKFKVLEAFRQSDLIRKKPLLHRMFRNPDQN